MARQQGLTNTAGLQDRPRKTRERHPLNTHGTVEYSEAGVDLVLLRENLRFTPAQRLQNMLGTVRLLEKAEAVRRARRAGY